MASRTNRPTPVELPVGHAIPRGAALKQIVHAYEALDDAIPCGLPECHAPHKKGFVVEFERKDGTLGQGLVGHVCGGNTFGGVTWKAKVTDFQQRMRRQEMAETVQECLTQCDAADIVLPSLLEFVAAADQAQAALEEHAGELVADARDAIRSAAGQLHFMQQRTGHARTFVLRGASFWTRPVQAPLARRLQTDIAIVRKTAADEATTPARLGHVLINIGSVAKRVGSLVESARSDLLALDQRNFTQLVDAYSGEGAGEFVRIRRPVVEAYSEPFKFAERKWMPIFDLGAISRLGNALTEALKAEAALTAAEQTDTRQ